MKRLLIGGLVLLAGCGSADTARQERLTAQLKPYIGKTLTAYMQETGESPVTSYDTTDSHRYFVFNREMTVVVPGMLGGTELSQIRCNKTVETRRTGPAESPDVFVIVSITAVGC